MISELFVKILNMSLTAGLVILFVLIARLLLKKAPRIFSYCLWAVVLYRLLCPISFSSPLSLLGTVGEAQVEQGSLEYISEELLVGTREQLQPPVINEAAKPGEIVQQEKRPDAGLVYPISVQVLSFLWIVGVVAMAGYDVVTLRKLQSKLKGAVKVRGNIYTSTLPIPFVMGLFRPRIYLPVDLQGEEQEYILLHEQIHIKRCDHLMKLLASVAMCIHWFNPLVWVAFFLSSKDMEMSCDEAVLRKMGNGVKKEYSASLLNLATGKNVISGVPLAFGEGDTGSRIKNVLRYKKPATIVVCVAVVVCLVLGICLVSNPTTGNNGEQDYFLQRLTAVFHPDNADESEDPIVGRENQVETQQRAEQAAQSSQKVEEQSVEKLFTLDIRGISAEKRTIENYVYYPEWQAIWGEEPISIAQDCVFEANYQMDSILYEEISYEDFVELVQKDWSTRCYATVDEQSMQLIHIQVQSAHAYQGIYSSGHSNDAAFWVYQDLVERYGDTVLEDYFQLASTVEADIADSEGVETIEIYSGILDGYEEVGILLYKNAQGDILGTDGIYSYPHPTTYYVNETPEGTYLMQIHLENRDTHGEYYYCVYRLSEQGDIQNIAGSRFSWSSGTIYDEEAFCQWLDKLNYYYAGSHFLMEAREDEIGVNETADANRYTFENLSNFTKYDEATSYVE